MKIVICIISALALLTMVSCGKKQKAEETEKAPKYLVLYYSQGGATKGVAEEIQRIMGADIEAIEVAEPYSGSYEETIARCIKEQQDSVIPEINPLNVNIDDYDVVFLGFPVWFGTYARPIMGLLEKYDFAGKKIVPFATFGSGGIEASSNDLAEALPKAEIAEGYGVRNARIASAPKEVSRFLINNGYAEGVVEYIPGFGEQHPVTEEEVGVFEAACGDYQFPLGTPVAAAQRETPDGTEYMFTVDSFNKDGDPVLSTIYVIVAGDSKPEFTRVVR